MKLTVMTIIISLLSCLQIVRTFFHMRSGIIGIRSSLAWVVLWMAIGLGGLYPSAIDYFVRLVQMEDRMYFIFLLSLLVLFVIVFDLASKLEKIRKDLFTVVQDLAMMKHVPGEVQQRKSPERNNPDDA